MQNLAKLNVVDLNKCPWTDES